MWFPPASQVGGSEMEILELIHTQNSIAVTLPNKQKS